MNNFNYMLSTNMISNCPTSVAYIRNADKIYGPSVASLKSKSKRIKPGTVIKDDIHIPSGVYKNNSNFELCIDIAYINGVSFLLYIYIQVKYISIIHITSQNEEEFSKGLDKIL